MKIAIVGSRNLKINDLEDYIPSSCSEIVSGGAKNGKAHRIVFVNNG